MQVVYHGAIGGLDAAHAEGVDFITRLHLSDSIFQVRCACPAHAASNICYMADIRRGNCRLVKN